jgi:alkyldihydroxyacetonephosphate synthase
MKWWGWGDEGISFTHEDKPALAPFVLEQIGIDLNSKAPDVPDFDQLDVAAPILTPELRARLEAAVGESNVSIDPVDRVVHTYGKSLRDLVRVRAGDLGRLPDVIVFPGSEHEVASLFEAALEADAVVIPFGGGTNISGSLEAPRGETRTVISVDLGRMNKVLEIDEPSGLARIQAGALGPFVEEQLNARGFTMGHFPDSFTYSTLGGWIATRSSGMQSDKYGDIADLTRAVRVVTPNGLLETRPVPTTSTGPSVREMVLGSEGRLGIITEATVHVHRLPDERVILGYLFPDWQAGLAAMRDIAASDASPSVTRVSDARETQFSFATSKDSGFVGKLQTTLLKQFLQRRKGFDLEQMCLSFIGYEGAEEHVKRQRKLVGDIVKAHGGLCVGSRPGELYDQKKFDTPYIRDFLLDRGGMADVSETSAPWSALLDLYEGVTDAAWKTFSDIGTRGWIMCHLSHSYHAGACLYFTFAFKPTSDDRALAEYDRVKVAIQSEFMARGATLSHHHAVGVEHQQWLADDISPAGVAMVKALLDGVDPGHNLNPGKIVPD